MLIKVSVFSYNKQLTLSASHLWVKDSAEGPYKENASGSWICKSYIAKRLPYMWTVHYI